MNEIIKGSLLGIGSIIILILLFFSVYGIIEYVHNSETIVVKTRTEFVENKTFFPVPVFVEKQTYTPLTCIRINNTLTCNIPEEKKS